MSYIVATVLLLGGVLLVVFRIPLAQRQRRSQARLRLVSPEKFTPALVAFLGAMAVLVGASLLFATLVGNVK